MNLVSQLHQQGVHFKSLTDTMDTGTTSGQFFFHLMVSLAEMERELTGERTRAGLEVARQLGRKGERKGRMTGSKIKSAKKVLAQRCAAAQRGQEPRRVRAHFVPLDSSVAAGLKSFKF